MKEMLNWIFALAVSITILSGLMPAPKQEKEYRVKVIDVEMGASKVLWYEVEPAFKVHNPNEMEDVEVKVIKVKGGVEVEREGVTYKVNPNLVKDVKVGDMVNIPLKPQTPQEAWINEALEEGKVYTFTTPPFTEEVVRYTKRDEPIYEIDGAINEVKKENSESITCIAISENKEAFVLFNEGIQDEKGNEVFSLMRLHNKTKLKSGVYIQRGTEESHKIKEVNVHIPDVLKECVREEGDIFPSEYEGRLFQVLDEANVDIVED